MSQTVKKYIYEIIDFERSKTNSSNFTKSFISEHKGEIPVYGASLVGDEVSYGYVQDNLEGIKYFDDCLTWNIDGSTGIFYRKGRFSLSEKVIPLIPFDEVKDTIDLRYLKYAIMFSKEFSTFGFSNKAGKGKLKNIAISIPVKVDGTFDLNRQKELALKYQAVEMKRKELLDKISYLNSSKIVFDADDTVYSEVSITDLFVPKNGNGSYTKEWCQAHSGNIPLYSGNTFGAFAFIDVADYEGEYITWAKDGLAGFMLYHNGKFSLTGHRGILLPTEKCRDIDLLYIKYLLEPIFRANIKGRLGINGKNEYTTLNATMIKKIPQKLKIPIKPDGCYDIEKQRELSQKYAKVESIKRDIYQQIVDLTSITVL